MAETKDEAVAEMQKCLPQAQEIIKENALPGESWNLHFFPDDFQVILGFKDKSGVGGGASLRPDEVRDMPSTMARFREKYSGQIPASPSELALLEAIRKLCE